MDMWFISIFVIFQLNGVIKRKKKKAGMIMLTMDSKQIYITIHLLY